MKFKKESISKLVFIILMVFMSRIIYAFVIEVWNELNKTNFSIVTGLVKWDAGWYWSIIEKGYSVEPSGNSNGDGANWAFFPLYPLSVRVFKLIFNINTLNAGFILSTIFFIIALYYSYNYISLTRNNIIAKTFIILITFGPYSFYFSTLYTESLFILLTILCFYNLQKQNWIYCGIFGALLSATRVTGVIFVIPLFIKMFFLHYASLNNVKRALKEFFTDYKKLLALFLIPAGLFAYMTFLYWHVGDTLAFQRIQLSWGRTNGNPFKVLMQLIDGLFGKGGFGKLQSQYLALWGIFGIFCSVYLLIKKRIEEGLFSLILIFIPLISSITSLPRYFIGTITLVIALNDMINKLEDYKWPVIIFLSAINIPLLFLWIAQHPITI